MTDRGWTARQPDGTPVEDCRCGRPRSTPSGGGVLTLGRLRAMGDRELLRLRRFGPVALADVRFLVPPPGGQRERRRGDHRRPRLHARRRLRAAAGHATATRPRRLLGYTADSLLPGGRVTVVLVPSGRRQLMAGTEWAAWAGEPVGR